MMTTQNSTKNIPSKLKLLFYKLLKPFENIDSYH